jgi:GWxTD domain-containing protein
MPRCRSLSLSLALFLPLAVPRVLVAQSGTAAASVQSRPATSPGQFSSRISCADAAKVIDDQAAGRAIDSPVFHFGTRSQADDALRELTNLALGSPQCAAAYGVRALLKWRLMATNYVPKDAPGQRTGLRWNEDAIYDLVLGAGKGDRHAGTLGVVASQLLLPQQPTMPWMVRLVGPDLLRSLANASSVADTVRHFQRGRLAAWLWEAAVADSAFSAYIAAGGDSVRGNFEIARIQLALGVEGAEHGYYAAAGRPDSAIVEALSHDLAFVADSAQLDSFALLQPEERAGWLRSFWEGRDLEALQARGTRLADHYERIGYARQNYRLLTYPRRYELNELWQNPDAEYDDRGLMYIRHGMPDDTAAALRAGACPNVSWLYRRAEGNLVFHFVARENPDDWRLIETLANAGGGRGASTRVSQAGPASRCAPIDGLAESRANLDPMYRRLAVSDNHRNWQRELDFTTRSREVGTTTDSDQLHFADVLGVAWRAYGLLGDAPGRGRILVLTSVAAEDLVLISQQPLGYGFRMRLVARSGPQAVEIDTVRRLAVREAPQPGQMLTFVTEVPVATGEWWVGVVVRQPANSSGQFGRDRDVAVPAAGGGLALSDIVLGTAVGGRAWEAPDGPFPLSATGSYAQGEPLPVYYEVAGASEGSDLTTAVLFARDDDDGDGTTINFSEQATGAVQRFRRELDTRRLDEGRYTLSVTVRAADGSSQTRRTQVFIREE